MIVRGSRVRITGPVPASEELITELMGKEARVLDWIADTAMWAVQLVDRDAYPRQGPLPVGIVHADPAHLERSANPFELLDDDALAMPLVRTPASAHAALFATSRRLRIAVSSATFLSDRLTSGCAEVSVEVAPPLDEDEGGDGDDDDELNGCRGDYSCTRHFSATFRVDNARAGSIGCTLIDRTACRRGRMFLTACDAESQELIDIGKVLFNEKGFPRYAPLKADAATRGGGFLYIKTFSLRGGLRPSNASELASRVIKQLLALPLVAPRWEVAAYIGDGRDPAGRDRDLLPFVRANFEAVCCQEAESSWVVTSKALQAQPALSHQQALRLQQSELSDEEPPGRSEPQGVNRELFEAIMRFPSPEEDLASLMANGPELIARSEEAWAELKRAEAEVEQNSTPETQAALSAAVESAHSLMLEARRLTGVHGRLEARTAGLEKVMQLLDAGASLDDSSVLHCSAAYLQPQLLRMFAHRGADVNALDSGGSTPLMVAVVAVHRHSPRNNRQADTRCIDVLLELGADVSLTDRDGLSALGRYRATVRKSDDLGSLFGGGVRNGPDPSVEAKLRPPTGPTPADEDMNESQSEEEKEEEDEEEDDDEDDDDDDDDDEEEN